jgi:hypothetical protein
MKRVLTFLAIMLLPLSVMAMTPVSDSTLSDVTGQAGVNINADLTMNIAIGTMAWGDADGITGTYNPWTAVNTGGYIGITGFNINNLRIKAREQAGTAVQIPVPFSTASTAYQYTTAQLKPITIDVATGTKLGTANVTFVRFGIGALQVTMDALSFTVKACNRTSVATLATQTSALGVMSLGNIGLYFVPTSYVDIYAMPAGVGVNLEFNVMLDRVQLDYVSWGDTDGTGTLPGMSGGIPIPWFVGGGAGYVGLQNLQIGAVSMAGIVQINVGTGTGTGVYGTATVVHISFPAGFSFNIGGPITADVRLGASADLSTGAYRTLGDIYISGLRVNVTPNSWVDIWAH